MVAAIHPWPGFMRKPAPATNVWMLHQCLNALLLLWMETYPQGGDIRVSADSSLSVATDRSSGAPVA
jgi:hypothetical protein